MKRFFIISVLLFTLFVGLFAGLIYLFDINQWLAEQIEKSTGYQVSFELIESRGWQAPGFSVSGLSVAVAKKELLHIDKINIVISELNLWQRQLELELVELVGVALSAQADTFKKVTSEPKEVPGSDNKSQLLPWSNLQINKLRISGLDAEISAAQQTLSVQQGSLSSDNLTIIAHNKLRSAFLKGNVQLAFKALNLQMAAAQALRIHDLSLNGYLDLARLQAKLTVATKQLAFTLPEQEDIIVDNSLLDVQLDKNKVSLTRLSADLFSGELALQAEALLFIDLLPTPVFSVEELTVLSLLAKDMQIQIPAFMQEPENEALAKADKKQRLPIKTLLLKQIDLHNIAVGSEEKQLPLTVKGVNFHLQDFYLLQNNQLADLSADNKPTGLFNLQFDYLQWADSVTGQFQVAGSFSEDAQHLLILKELLKSGGSEKRAEK